MIRAGVVGATGYVGSELVRWLLGHPAFALEAVVSTTQAGTPLSTAVPGLLGLTDLVLAPFDGDALSTLDLVFLATPHGAARALVGSLERCRVVVDASADHRHVAGWVYGQPEWFGASLRGARRVAAPGCFATALTLGLAPFVAAGGVGPDVFASGVTGSTGAGATATAGTHHPERFANLRAYKVLTHQHVPEVRATLSRLGPAPAVRFVPHSGPFDRGILATCFVPFDGDAVATLDACYADRPLVRRRAVDQVEVRTVRATAFADVGVAQDERSAVVVVAIDNLGKGASAQAVQAANLVFELPETTGLLRAPATP